MDNARSGLPKRNPVLQAKTKPRNLQERARNVVLDYALAHLDKSDDVNLTIDDVYIVWFCYILGYWKALVSTSLPDGMYYEVTFNDAGNEAYLDAYKKYDNVRVSFWDVQAEGAGQVLWPDPITTW